MNHSRRDSVGDGHVVTGAAIPSIRQQIEQLSTLASKASAESSSRRGVISDETRRLISESSSERGRRLQLETREQYMATLRRLGQATTAGSLPMRSACRRQRSRRACWSFCGWDWCAILAASRNESTRQCDED